MQQKLLDIHRRLSPRPATGPVEAGGPGSAAAGGGNNVDNSLKAQADPEGPGTLLLRN